MLIGTLGGALFGVVALVTETRTNQGAITGEAIAVGIGLFACTALTWIGSKIGDDDADQSQAERHTTLLTSIGREAQRLSADDIRVVVTWTAQECVPKMLNALDDRWVATLSVDRDRSHLPADVNEWSFYPLL